MIRALLPTDTADFLDLMHSFAVFDGSESELKLSKQQVEDHFFGANPSIYSYVMELGNRLVGFINFYYTFSSFEGERCIWVEDAYLEEPYRRKGHGAALFNTVRDRAITDNCARVEWLVRDDNKAGQKFDQSIGAIVDPSMIYVKWRG